MKHLYEITADMAELRHMLEGDQCSIDEIADTMELLELDFAEKVENSAKLIKSLSHDALACKVEGNRLLDRGKRLESRIKWLTDYITTQMVRAGRPKLELPLFNVTVRTAVQTVFLSHPESVPAEYCREEVITKIDKGAIKAALVAGDDVPGAELLDGKKWLDIR